MSILFEGLDNGERTCVCFALRCRVFYVMNHIFEVVRLECGSKFHLLQYLVEISYGKLDVCILLAGVAVEHLLRRAR